MMSNESGMKNIVKTRKQGLLFFWNNVKIENYDFIIILDHANLNDMMYTTNYCSNPMDKFLGGSMTYIESPWTLNITSILLNASEY